jgi:hypothetical protein
MRIGHHADAVDNNGRSVLELGYSDWCISADFPKLLLVDGDFVRDDSTDGLDQAREWAAKIIASDSRVAAVHIRESVQEYEGCSWKAGRHVDTIGRPASEPQHDHSRFNLCFCGFFWE